MRKLEVQEKPRDLVPLVLTNSNVSKREKVQRHS